VGPAHQKPHPSRLAPGCGCIEHSFRLHSRDSGKPRNLRPKQEPRGQVGDGRLISSFIKKAFEVLGLEVHRRRPDDSRWASEVLRRAAPPIGTCVDVGVGTGTPELYEAFPDAYHVLIEPLDVFEPSLRAILSRYRGEAVRAAVGARSGTLPINLDVDTPLKSSFLRRTPLTQSAGPSEQRQVPVTTLDELLGSRSLERPYGIKIDTEGFELEVLAGARSALSRTAFVIAEVSYGPRFEGGYTFSDLTRLMVKRGFYLHEILQVVGRPVLYVDALFLRTPSASPTS